MKPNTFFSNGKLMLTGEYFVLDGARALALPTIYGQTLSVVPTQKKTHFIHWQSFVQDELWLDFLLDENLELTLQKGALEKATIIQQLFKILMQKVPALLQKSFSYEIKINADFPRNWGLGSSATLIGNIAKWSGLNGFELNEKIFGGSGYDIAVALEGKPLLYEIHKSVPIYRTISLPFNFVDNLYFVHLNQKQNSREGIAHYKKLAIDKQPVIQTLNSITQNILQTQSLEQFENLLQQHENLIAQTLHLPKAKDLYFADYWGAIKSLGAWGGDFILATSHKNENDTRQYFHRKGYTTILAFKDIIFAA